MKFCILTILIFALVSASNNVLAGGAARPEVPDLMPVPHSVRVGEGRVDVDRNLSYGFAGAADDRLRRYAFRVMRRIERRTVIEFGRAPQTESDKPTILINARRDALKVPKLKEDESYSLTIKGGRVLLRSETGVGAMRGLETLVQLLKSDEKGFYFPEIEIIDKPRFPWRGLLIDVARHYQPMHVLKRNIDGLAAVKMNVLHWHLTEDQGFRVESKKFPKLHGLGSDGLFYTQDEIREIIRYAADRGIRVVPEFDMPGHATSWLVGYPELASQPGPYEIERDPGIFDPTLNPIKEETYEFLAVFLEEMANLFPDAYVHIGGDENEGKHWDANPEIQAFMKKRGIKDNHELQTYFNKRVLAILQKHNKTMMGWDEIFQPDLPKDVVIHSWRGQKALAEAARQGYFGVLSNGYYIDLIYPASDHYLVDPVPADSDLTREERQRVLGGEATMWGEWVSDETIDSRIWPRTAAIAERLWSRQEVRDVDDMYRRLGVMSIRLENLGLTHKRNRRMMLRRLAQSENISDLELLTSLIEPVKQYQRYQQRKQTMLSPLTGLIDAAGPDAHGAREFNLLAKQFPRDPAAETKLTSVFNKWVSTGNALEPLMKKSGGLHEAVELASKLRNLGQLGLRVLEARKANASDEELKRMHEKLKELLKPAAAIEFAVGPGMKELIGIDDADKKDQKQP